MKNILSLQSVRLSTKKINYKKRTIYTIRHMRLEKLLYQSFSYIRHILRAKNTLGYGIHSPFLYYLVHFVMYDDNAYYCYATIEKERRRLLSTDKIIETEDYGTGESGKKKISSIAEKSLKSRQEAQMIFRIANAIKPQYVIELGTSLGITTAYLAKAAPKGQVVTIEGSQNIAKEAEKTFRNLHIDNITQTMGNIDEKLSETLQGEKTIDLAFIDANHSKEPTLRYFRQIASHCTENSIVIIDDIHSSLEMSEAWTDIQKEDRVTACLDCFSMGIVFFRPNIMKETYYLHI